MNQEEKLRIFFGWLFIDQDEDSNYSFRGKKVSVKDIKKIMATYFPKLFYKDNTIKLKI